MDITGMSEEQYRWFVRECYKNCKLRPGEPVAFGFWVSVSLAISLFFRSVDAAGAKAEGSRERNTNRRNC